MSANKFEENPVSSAEAAKILNVSPCYISALKNSLGIKSHKVFVSEFKKFLRNNPGWTTAQVYHRKTCSCERCLQKRAAQLVAKKPTRIQRPLGQPVVPAIAMETAIPAPETTQFADASMGKSRFRVSMRAKGALGVKLRHLRGDRRAHEVADKVGLSRESVYRIERGEPVKLTTVKGLAGVLGANRTETLDLLVAWIKQTVGEDGNDLVIQARSGEPTKHQTVLDRQASQVQQLLERLNETQREQLILALQSREILNCISTMVQLAGGVQGFPYPGVHL